MSDLFEKYRREKEEYISKYDVGFYVNNTQTKFIKTKRHRHNYNWVLKYNEIIGVACANIMRFDDDSFFIIIILENNKPIYFNKTYDSEEMQGFASFMDTLKEKIGFEPIWEEDKIVFALPENLRGKEIYKPWTSSINAFSHGIKRFFWLEHHASGIIKDEFKKELKRSQLK